METENSYFSVILSGDHGRLNYEVVSNIIGCKEVRLASLEIIEQYVQSRSLGIIRKAKPHLLQMRCSIVRYIFLPEKKKYKYLVKAVVFSLLINLVIFFIVPVLSGLFLSYLYTPDIIEAYDDVNYLQNEVSFGFILRPGNVMAMLFPFFLGIIAYFLILLVVKKIEEKRH